MLRKRKQRKPDMAKRGGENLLEEKKFFGDVPMNLFSFLSGCGL